MMRSAAIYAMLLFSLGAMQAQVVSAPVLAPAGYYTDSIFISIFCSTTGAQIYFTTDGSVPTINSQLYSQPIWIKDRSVRANGISLIPTNPSFTFPIPGYDSSRAENRGWLPPYDTVNKCTVLRAKAFKSGYSPSETSTATYFIGAQLNNRYPFPVVSISADSIDLFSDSTGIFVYGWDTTDLGNFAKPGVTKKVFSEFFDEEGNEVLTDWCDMRIHGNGGLYAPQKSLWLEASTGNFNYVFFRSYPLANLQEVLLRNSGHRPDCMPRDDVAGRIASGNGFEMQQQKYCIVFVNGEYWGIQSMKNLLNLKYLEAKYNISKYQACVISGGGVFDDGVPGDEIPYANFISFLQNTNITQQQNYDHVKTVIDVESFTDFQCSEIWLGNGDWPNNNTKLWRLKKGYDPTATNELDGRWHWMMFDLDAAFGGDCSAITPLFNTLSNAFDPSFGSSTFILRTLINNPAYKNYFINRMADLLNTTFLPTRVRSIMTKIDNELTPVMLEHVERWRYPSVATTLLARSTEIPSLTKWNTITSGLYSYAGVRPNKVRKHVLTYFSLADTVKVTLNVSDTAAGKIKMNSIYIDRFTQGIGPVPYPWTGTYFSGNAVTVEAIPNPGYVFVNWNDPSQTQNLYTVNITTDSLLTAVFAPDPGFVPLHYLFINEFMALNKTYLSDDHNEFDDWLEIYNPNSFSIDIADFYVTDDPANKKKYKISEGSRNTMISPKGFIILWADSQAWQGSIHTNFNLSGFGDELYLVLPDGNTVADSVIYPVQELHHSWGRASDGDPTWIEWTAPTPKASNLIRINDPNTNVILYPNPAYNTHEIFFTAPVNADIIDVLGNQIAELHDVYKFDITGLSKGIYFLRQRNGEIIKFVKL